MGKVEAGMRVSTRLDGTGTVLRSNGGEGWVIQYDNGLRAVARAWEIFTEDGSERLEG